LVNQPNYDTSSYCRTLVLTLDCIVLEKHTLKSVAGSIP
jgi:hypothetical protein